MRTYTYVPAKSGFSAGSATNLLALFLSILYVYATVLSRYEEISRVNTDREGKMGLVMRTHAYVPAKPGFSAGSATNLLALYPSIVYVYTTVLSRYEEVSRVDTDREGKNGSGYAYACVRTCQARFLCWISD